MDDKAGALGINTVAYNEGYEKGKAEERERIALCLKNIDDTWGMLFLSDLFENGKDKETKTE